LEYTVEFKRSTTSAAQTLYHDLNDLPVVVAGLDLGVGFVIDLEAAGVPVGQTYQFLEWVRLGQDPDAPGSAGLFVLDPLIGTAVPEPTTLCLLSLGGTALLQRRGVRA
jgi:hypothetical protein